MERKILFVALRNRSEHNPATVYKPVYLGEMTAAADQVGWCATQLDFDVDDVSHTGLVQKFSQGFDVIALWSEVHHARLAKNIAELAKAVTPNAKIFVYGRATAFIPQYFERSPFDAVHIAGDREASIASYLTYLESSKYIPNGVSLYNVKINGFRRLSGLRLPSDKWLFPDLKSLPMDQYAQFAKNTHGQEYTPRVSLTVSKGCHFACGYCGATPEEGKQDRRRPLESLFHWIEDQGINQRDEIVHLFSADLFADAEWIKRFSTSYTTNHGHFLWRGVTTIVALQDEAVVQTAAANGCREIAVGIETLNLDNGRTAKSTYAELEKAVFLTSKYGISLKGLVMLGYPRQTEKAVQTLEKLAQGWNMVLRFTGYTPLHRLRFLATSRLDEIELERFDRRTYFDAQNTLLSYDFFQSRVLGDGGYFKPSDMPQRSILA